MGAWGLGTPLLGVYPKSSCGHGGTGIWFCQLPDSSLSMFSSKTWAACNTHWYASLASWRALSGRLSLPQVQGQGLVWWPGCRIGTSAPHMSSSCPWIPLLSHRQHLREDTISLMASSICLGLKGSGPGSPLSMYTSWNRSLISSQEVLYPTSWMTGISTSGSSPGRPCW